MDHFGIGNALRALAQAYFHGSRSSGRTTRLLDSLKDGDRIICADPREAERLRSQCRQRNLAVECITTDPRDLGSLLDRPKAQRRTVFEHGWVERYYQARADRAASDLDHFEKQLSTWDGIDPDPRPKPYRADWRE